MTTAKYYGRLGKIYYKQGNLHGALTAYKNAKKIDPQNVGIYNNLGLIYRKKGKIEKSLEFFNKGLRINPDYENIHINLGSLYELNGFHLKAIEHYAKAIKINPKNTEVYPNLYFQLRHIFDWKLSKELERKIDQQPKYENPFVNIVRTDNPRKNLKAAEIKSKKIIKSMSPLKKSWVFKYKKNNNDKKIMNKLKIGYVSDGFRDFPTGHNIVGVFENINQKRFKTYIYSHGGNDKSNWRKRIRNASTKFVDITNLSAEQSAKKIHKDNIDILVDLKGHTKGSRLEIFALRPAPIQISYLGFPGTTGASFIDFVIADEIVIPKKEKKYYKEKVVYLPNCYRATDNKTAISKSDYKKIDFKLPPRSFVFSSLNQTYKITPKVLNLWIKILKGVPNSILWLLSDNSFAEKNIKRHIEKNNLEVKRLIFTKKLRKTKHLARLKFADLALDTFIVNGHTTTVDSLWASVPVLTVKGNHFASRVSESVLNAIGLPELVTKNPNEYKNLAINLAQHPKKLIKLKKKLEANKNLYPLFNTRNFTRNFEEVFDKVYRDFFQNTD